MQCHIEDVDEMMVGKQSSENVFNEEGGRSAQVISRLMDICRTAGKGEKRRIASHQKYDTYSTRESDGGTAGAVEEGSFGRAGQEGKHRST